MVKNSETSFYVEVWATVEPRVKVLQNQTPGNKNAEQWAKHMKEMKKELERVKEFRNAPFNLAQLLDPGAVAIPEDVLEMVKVKKSAKFYFWDKDKDCPKAPDLWPRGRNVPIVLFDIGSKDLGGPFLHYGHCSVIAGFFCAFAMALTEPAWQDNVAGFEKLCVNALADFKVVSNRDEVSILAFNAVEENEESRENDGFTGTRRALLVGYAVKRVIIEKKGQKWTYPDVHDWLKANIKFHDDKAIPSAHTCKELYSLVNDFIKNRRAFAAYQEAETAYGRQTMFDEYSKLTIMNQKSRSPEDLAFIAEYLVAEMKANTPSSRVPDNPSQSKLKEYGGPICFAQAVRDALSCLLHKDTPPTWANFGDLVQKLAQPRSFLEMFPPGGKTPEATCKLFAACPQSLKHAITIIRQLYNMSKTTNTWKERVIGFLNGSGTWFVSEKKLLEMFEAFTEEWDAFKDARDVELGRAIQKKKSAEPQADDEAKPKADEGGAAGATTSAEKQKKEEDEVADKKQAIRAKATQKAQAVYTNPGAIILTPKTWETSALSSLVTSNDGFQAQGGFVAFWFSASDREARVQASQNICLREAPTSKARLSSFCSAIDGIMVECRDAVVIGAGKGKGNMEVVREVVANMKWQHKVIDAVTERAAYENFIQSGSPPKKKKKKCFNGGLASTTYKTVYVVCWKPTADKSKSFNIKSGLRRFVDQGSPIASDILLHCPQVPLDAIYAVSPQRKTDALGDLGLETKDEAQLNFSPKDLILPPCNS